MDFFFKTQKQDEPVWFALITAVLVSAFKTDGFLQNIRPLTITSHRVRWGFGVGGLLLSKWSKK